MMLLPSEKLPFRRRLTRSYKIKIMAKKAKVKSASKKKPAAKKKKK